MPFSGDMNERGVRKLHMVGWDTVSRPKSEGGLVVKIFKLMNQALIAKQFWRLMHKPQSLLAQALASKYCPREPLYSHKPNKNHSWIWRNLLNRNFQGSNLTINIDLPPIPVP